LITWTDCGVSVMGTLIVGLVTLPLLGSALVAVMSWRGWRSTAHYVALTATAVTALCALALLPSPLTPQSWGERGDGPTIAVEWLPGAGPMELGLGTTGLYAVLVTTWGAFLVLLGASPFIPPTGRERGGGGEEYPPWSGTVMLLALAAANVAFLAEHFLARYVALEIVALCIALALVVELRNTMGIRLAWSSYLLLRLGDAGLLTAILILMDASGTLRIGPALEFALSAIERAGGALEAGRLAWVVAGLVLAVWVKLGGWPFHLWSQSGRRLALASQAWLYATVMPNLGMYLLYRVTPLLALAGSLQTAALWLGAGGAALAMLIGLTRADPRSALVYVGAAHGGLTLFVAASGVEAAVWLGLLALTPLRLLLFLAAEAAQGSDSPAQRRVAAGSFALGGLALTAFGLLTTWWARRAGVPLDALFVAEVAVALSGIWAVHVTGRLLSIGVRDASYEGLPEPVGASPIPPPPVPPNFGGPPPSSPPLGGKEGGQWTRWMAIGTLNGGVLAGGLGFRPLARHLVAAAGMAWQEIPTLPALLRYAVTTPAVLVVMVLVLAGWQLQRRLRAGPLVAAVPEEEAYDLEEGLARAAQALHAVVEVGILEQIVALVVRVVVDGARLTYRVVEQEGLEGLLRRSVRAVLRLSRGLQRWHTGRLRYNLLWVVVSLALAVLALVLYGG